VRAAGAAEPPDDAPPPPAESIVAKVEVEPGTPEVFAFPGPVEHPGGPPPPTLIE